MSENWIFFLSLIRQLIVSLHICLPFFFPLPLVQLFPWKQNNKVMFVIFIYFWKSSSWCVLHQSQNVFCVQVFDTTTERLLTSPFFFFKWLQTNTIIVSTTYLSRFSLWLCVKPPLIILSTLSVYPHFFTYIYIYLINLL